MRRRTAIRREVIPDPKFNNKTISRFINMLMVDGKKWNAEKIVYGSLDIVLQKTQKTDALEVLTKAIDNVRPLLELKSRRVGGATYQIPVEVRETAGHRLRFDGSGTPRGDAKVNRCNSVWRTRFWMLSTARERP